MSCYMTCPNSGFSGCENDIEVDWLVMNPRTYEIYSINSENERVEFSNKYGMTFIFTRLHADQCLISGVQYQNFNVTLSNFNATLKELLVICGLRRINSGVTTHAIKLFALLKRSHATTLTG